MIKVKIENPTGHNFDVRFPGASVSIPPYSIGDDAVFIDLPQLPVVEKWLESLTTRYRAVKATIISEDGAENASSDDEDNKLIDGAEGTEDKEDELLAEFKTKVKAIEKTRGGWWSVDIGESEPVSVRGCDNEDEAVIAAFEKYIEG